MIATAAKAWTVGLAILVAANGVWFFSLQASAFSELLVWLLWLSPVLAALATSYLSPRKKMLLGISMAIPAAVLAVVLNIVYESLGNAVDFSGSRGALTLFAITLAYSGVGSTIGSFVGYILAKKLRNDGVRHV